MSSMPCGYRIVGCSTRESEDPIAVCRLECDGQHVDNPDPVGLILCCGSMISAAASAVTSVPGKAEVSIKLASSSAT